MIKNRERKKFKIKIPKKSNKIPKKRRKKTSNPEKKTRVLVNFSNPVFWYLHFARQEVWAGASNNIYQLGRIVLYVWHFIINNCDIIFRNGDPIFFPWIRLSWKKNPALDSTLIRNEEKNIIIFLVGRHKINHHFKLEFVDSGFYFLKDENNFINPFLQVGSGSNKKSTGSVGPKINGFGSSSLYVSRGF